MRERLLDRDAELHGIAELVAATSRGQGRTLVLEGQPGLGKSQLLAAGAQQARELGIAVASFACGELETDLAWSGTVGLLDAATEALAPARRRGLFEGAAAPAAALLADPAAWERDGELEPFALIHALYLVIERLADGGPLLLSLDDAHWSDTQTLRLMLYLARRAGRLPVGLLLALRPQAAAEQRELIGSILSGPDATSYSLRSLSLEAVCELVRAAPLPDPTDAFCAACHQVTAGNPFYVQELLSELARNPGHARSPEALLQNPPETISRSILIRLRRTPRSGAQRLAQAVAVLGDGATLAHAAELAELSAEQAADVADALTEDEILATGAEPLRFVHPLVRAAVYADMPAAQRSRRHAVAADILERDHAGPEVVGVHLLHVPRAARAQTVARLRAAAAAARRHGAPGAAARYLRRALEEPPSPQDLGAVLVQLAEAEAQNGDPAAVEHLEQALELMPAGRHAQILMALGWAQHHAGRFALAARAFERGLQAAPATEAELRAELEAGYLQSATLEASRAADAAGRIGVIEARIGEERGPAARGLLAQTLFGRVMFNATRDGVIELALRLWSGGQLLDEEGAGSQVAWHVVGALSWVDAGEPSRAIATAMIAAATEEGNALAIARGRYALSWLNFWSARLDDARAAAREAVDIWYGGLETYLPAAVYWLILAELERGELAAAEAAFGLNGSADRWEGTGMAGFVHAAAGHIAAHRGDAELALAEQRRCGDVMKELNIVSPAVMPWRSEAAMAAALTDERAEGARLAEEELSLARVGGVPRAIGRALRVNALFAEPAAAVALLEDSVSVLEGSGAVLELCRSSLDLGAALRRRGHRRAARPTLRRGLEIASAAGATGLVAHARTELRAAGGRVAGEGDHGPGALTASERRVAELAAAGHANRMIAARLQISIKAVEWHLSQTYRKLGVSGRRQLATALAPPAGP